MHANTSNTQFVQQSDCVMLSVSYAFSIRLHLFSTPIVYDMTFRMAKERINFSQCDIPPQLPLPFTLHHNTGNVYSFCFGIVMYVYIVQTHTHTKSKGQRNREAEKERQHTFTLRSCSRTFISTSDSFSLELLTCNKRMATKRNKRA